MLPLFGDARDLKHSKGKESGVTLGCTLRQTASTRGGLTMRAWRNGPGIQDEHKQEATRLTRNGNAGGGAWAQWWDGMRSGHVVTARSCCLEVLLCNVVWMAAQASRMAVGGSESLQRAVMTVWAW